MITNFSGDHRFLSNFYPSTVWVDGMSFPTVEHAYQASKTLDLLERRAISMLPTPGRAKRHGKIMSVRYDWDNRKLETMKNLVSQKFSRHDFLKVALILTNPHILIEGNNWGDTFWGAELAGEEWIGENHLGKILMDLREGFLK